MAVAFLLLAAAAGAGMTHLSGLDLGVEERLAFGSVLGLMAAGAAAFGLALALGFGLPAVVLGLLAAVAAGSAGWWSGRRRLRSELGDARGRLLALWPLWLLLAACSAYTIYLMAGAYVVTPAGLDVWGIGVYSDWAAHLTYAGSFAYGQNVPPESPIAPGHRLGYPFMVDFLAAELVALGVPLTVSLVLTSGYLLLGFPAVMALAARRLAGGIEGAVLGVLVFLLGGGLGFAILHNPRLYTQDAAQNLQWLNPVLAYLLPQRSILFGLDVALIVAALLFAARGSASWRPFLFAGAVAGLAPAFHVHGYGTAVALPAFWALSERRRQWLGFFAPALLLGVPAVLWLVQPGASDLRLQLGWMAASGGAHDSWPWFWIKNTGIFIPVLLVAQFWPGVAGAFRLLFAPMWLWFAAPNIWVFQPWDWDNTKFLVFWYAFGAILVGALLVRLASRHALALLAAAGATAVLCASGGADLGKLIDRGDRGLFTDSGGIAAAGWVRAHTEARAVFLVAPNHNEPIPALGGRRVVAGYAGWLWTYGIPDWAQRTQDAQAMLQGKLGTSGYRVDYVVVGPQERALGASDAYWSARGDLVYSSADYSIYRLTAR
jgi:hypothetical protein